ncbi:MAG: efflux RND transporter permease subunit [Eubacterium sp.]|jgi:predicted RND superfamily exporter protein
MHSFGEKVVKHRKLILMIALVLMIPSVIGMSATRINYDMLVYLPDDMDTVKGQDILMDEFGKGAISTIIVEGMTDREVADLKADIAKVEHVDSVVWYDSVMDLSVPKEMLPDEIYDSFNSGDATMLAVFFDTTTSADETMDAVKRIRRLADKECFVTGMSAVVTDLKDLCEKEEPIYVGLAVACAVGAMMLFMDSWFIPFVFLASIGMAILLNMGTNFFLGEISYITKAIAAVLQLAVTMDYSIFLWHSYEEQTMKTDDHEQAMAAAINKTMTSVIGSSITTVAGFIALCFMSYTLGADIGIVMAKGVLFGVLGCVTTLPALILLFDKFIHKTMHRTLLPKMDKAARVITKRWPVFIAIFALVLIPSIMGYIKTNDEVYYDMSSALPEDIESVQAQEKMSEDFGVESIYMTLVDSDLSTKEMKSMMSELDDVDGVTNVVGLSSIVGRSVPEEVIPDSLSGLLKSDEHQLILITSEYYTASDAVNEQVDAVTDIIKKYDENAMLVGEAPATKDLIEITNRDFNVVTIVSIVFVFVIIALVFKSFSLPILLTAVIECAISINLGIPHYAGQRLPFIAPIVISTIQLGSTVDYAILMTTRYRDERISGVDKYDSIRTALSTSMPSVIVSAVSFFAATFGVALYSNIDIVSSMCMLMARGALISMAAVIFVLPCLMMVFDRPICATTAKMRGIHKKEKAARLSGKENRPAAGGKDSGAEAAEGGRI